MVGRCSNGTFPGTGINVYQQFGLIGNSDVIISKMNPSGSSSTQSNIEWSTFYGGSSSDVGFGISINNTSHDVWIVGSAGDGLPITNSSVNYVHPWSGNSDGFVARFNSSGTQLLYATYLGGSDVDRAYCIGINQSDQSVYVAGETESNPSSVVPFQDLFTSVHSNSYNQINYAGPVIGNVTTPGFGDGFILRISNSTAGGIIINDLIWGTYFGGDLGERIRSLVILDDNKVIITGSTESITFANPSTTGQPCLANANGKFPDCDPSGSRYFDNSNNGYQDCFLAAFNSSDQLIWSTVYGGSYTDACNSSGALITTYIPSQTFYLTGFTYSSNFPVGGTGYTKSYSGMYDAFICKFDGYNRDWASYFGGTGDDIGMGITVDKSANVYVSGATESSLYSATCLPSSDFPICDGIGNLYAQPPLGSRDMFIAGFTNSNLLFWSTYLGGNSLGGVIEDGTSIVSGFDKLYLGGSTYAGGIVQEFPTVYRSNYYNQLFSIGGIVQVQENVVSVFDLSPIIGVKELGFDDLGIHYFPNPVLDFLSITINSTSGLYGEYCDINTLDMTGRLLQSTHVKISESLQNIIINTSQLTAGVYIFQLKSKYKMCNFKIVKQ